MKRNDRPNRTDARSERNANSFALPNEKEEDEVKDALKKSRIYEKQE